MQRFAEFSDCKNYRYSLSRIWEAERPKVLYIGLNPSSADALQDDPTIRRCIQFARSWGYGGMSIVNLFAFKHHDPKYLMKVKKPVGELNDDFIREHLQSHDNTVLIWGNHGAFQNRATEVLQWIKKPLCIKINKSGQPAHPLYLKKNLKPIPFKN